MLPYADAPHAYWSGFFSSRINAKGFIRDLSRYTKVANNLAAVESIQKPEESMKIKEMYEKRIGALGILQHHDAITGTAR
jgi:hypothetical protein